MVSMSHTEPPSLFWELGVPAVPYGKAQLGTLCLVFPWASVPQCSLGFHRSKSVVPAPPQP
jgi:hypothetical protein